MEVLCAKITTVINHAFGKEPTKCYIGRGVFVADELLYDKPLPLRFLKKLF